MILGLIERHSVEGYDCKIKKLKSLPVLSYFTFCNVLYIWACPGHPYLTYRVYRRDSMIADMRDKWACLPTGGCGKKISRAQARAHFSPHL